MKGFTRSKIKLALHAGALAVVMLAGGCSSGTPLQTYDLTAIRGPQQSGGVHGQMIVTEPVASTALETDRVLVRPQPESLAYLAGAKWSARLPALVQTRLIQSFGNSRSLKAVGRPGDHLTADYDLTSEIRNFEIDVQSNQAVVEIAARLVQDTTGRAVAAKIFTARVPANANDGAAAVHALDTALGQVMGEIVVWATRRE